MDEPTPTNTIDHEETSDRGAFVLSRDGRRGGRMAYRRVTQTLIVIDHTEVSDELRGQGVGRALLDTAVAWARATGTKVEATCPFVTAQFAEDAAIRDVLA